MAISFIYRSVVENYTRVRIPLAQLPISVYIKFTTFVIPSLYITNV